MEVRARGGRHAHPSRIPPPPRPRKDPLQEKLEEFKAENSLLGRVVKDLQAELEDKTRQLNACRGKDGQAGSKITLLNNKVKAAESEVAERGDRLAKQARIHSRQVKELEDALLDIKDEADHLKGRVEQLEKEKGTLRAHMARSERSLQAVEDAKMDADRMANQTEHMKRTLERKVESMERSMDTLTRDCGQQVCRFGAALESIESAWREAQLSWKADVGFGEARKAEWECTRRDLLLQLETLQGRNQQLQQALAHAQVDKRKAVRGKLEAHGEARGMAASLATLRQTDSATKAHVTEALQKIERLRGEVVEGAENAELAARRAASIHAEHEELLGKLKGAENAVKGAREEVVGLREALLEAKATTLMQVVELARAGAKDKLPGSGECDSVIEAYVRVLEHAIRESEEVADALRAGVKESQQQESQLREELEAARSSETALRSSLQIELRRVHRLEALRLSDVRELHDLETRLGILAQESTFLRDSLASERHRFEMLRATEAADKVEAASDNSSPTPNQQQNRIEGRRDSSSTANATLYRQENRNSSRERSEPPRHPKPSGEDELRSDFSPREDPPVGISNRLQQRPSFDPSRQSRVSPGSEGGDQNSSGVGDSCRETGGRSPAGQRTSSRIFDVSYQRSSERATHDNVEEALRQARLLAQRWS